MYLVILGNCKRSSGHNEESIMATKAAIENYDVEFAKEYLETGGLGEVIGFTELAVKSGDLRVQMFADMAMALCLLASEALENRKITNLQ